MLLSAVEARRGQVGKIQPDSPLAAYWRGVVRAEADRAFLLRSMLNELNGTPNGFFDNKVARS